MFSAFKWCFSVLVVFTFIAISDSLKYPVVLVPGDGGSQINAKLNKTTTVHYVCQKKTKDFFNIWLNLELLVPIVIDCWVDNMKLKYNNLSRTTSNNDGVETEIPGFGNSSVVEWLDPSKASPGAYFKDIGDALVAEGYTRDVNLRGAPYDFRKAPNENQNYFSNLINLIEETFTVNGNKSVVLIAHSMGGPMSLALLRKVTPQWKEKYIKALVGLSGAWAGSIKVLKVYLVGDNLNSYILNEKIVKEFQISLPSSAWLMPSKLFWKENEVLVQTHIKNYTVNDFQEFFQDIDFEIGWEIYKDVLPFRDDFRAPGVEVHCLHGYGVDTIERLIYKEGDFPLNYPTFVKGNGDGTVNIRSLEACLQWKSLQKQKVYHQPFPKVDHMNILRNKDSISYIIQLLKKLNGRIRSAVNKNN